MKGKSIVLIAGFLLYTALLLFANCAIAQIPEPQGNNCQCKTDNPGCFGQPNSTCSPGCSASVLLTCHTIDVGTFTSAIADFSSKGKVISGEIIRSQLNAGACDNSVLIVTANHNITDRNDDINIVRFEMPEDYRKKPLANRVYAYRLLEVIMSHNPESVAFYKGHKSPCPTQPAINDILLKVVYDATTTRYYDLSDSPPTIAGTSRQTIKE